MSSSTSNPADLVVKQHKKLPDSWIWQELGSLSVFINGDRGKNYPSHDILVDDGIPFINAGHLSNGRIDFSDMNFITQERFNLLNSGKVAPDDILFCLRGSLGKSALVNIPRGAIASSLVIIRVAHGIVPKYILYFLASPLSFSFVQAFDNGTAQPNLSAKSVRSFKVPLSPLPEQHRIVAAIESYLTRLDDAVASLERVKANLEKYRAAVLKAAVEGRLVPTEADLAQQEGRTYEPASELLKRILTERKRRWIDSEAERARARAEAGARKKGKQWTDADDRKALEQARKKAEKKYKEPIPPDTDGLPELPEGWCWSTIDQVSYTVRGSSPRPAGDPRYFGGTIPWITVGDLTADNSPYLRKVPATVTEEGCRKSRYIAADTLLITNSGATLGVPKITLIGGCINDGSVAMLNIEYPLKLYLYYYISTLTKSLRTINQGAAQPNLNTGIIRTINVPLPPASEQERIISVIESNLEAERVVNQNSADNKLRCKSLRQSILKWAFEGKLVDQDPSDEPASMLLARIKAERAGTSKRRTGGGARRRGGN